MMKEQAGMLGVAVIAAALLTAISLTVNAIAESKSQSQGQTQSRSNDTSRDRDMDRMHYPIYGSQLMSEREREEHRSKMRSMKTEQERDTYRLEHHKLMQERAKTKGITLPEDPPKNAPAMGGNSNPNK